MTTRQTFYYLYEKSSEQLRKDWKANIVGNTRKTYQQKYGLAMKNMLLHVLLESMKHKILFNPMMIVLDVAKPKDHWAVYDLQANHIRVKTKDKEITIQMSPLHSIVVTTFLDDYHDTIYLFHQCRVLPDKVTQKDMKVMNNYYSKLLKSCSIGGIGVSISSLKEMIADKPKVPVESVPIEKYNNALREISTLMNVIKTLETRLEDLEALYVEEDL